MTTKKTTDSQAQQGPMEETAAKVQASWTKALEEQVARLEQALTQLEKTQQQAIARMDAAIDQSASLAHSAVGYANELTAQWREMTLQMMRAAMDAIPKAA